MRARYVERSMRISITITDREPIFRCGRTHGATSDSAAGNGVRRGSAAGQRTASPLRTTGCLKASESTALRAASPWALKSVSELCFLEHACIGEFVHQTETGPETA